MHGGPAAGRGSTESELTYWKQHVPSARSQAVMETDQSGLFKRNVHTAATVTVADDSQLAADIGGGFGTKDPSEQTWESRMRRHSAAINMAALIAQG